MSNRAWMPLHIADYLADTGHLTATEHGAYILLIMHYWQNGSLPESERVISRIAKMTGEQWEESRDILAMLFGPGWAHKRIDAELAKADDIIGKRRSAAEARYAKGKKQSSNASEEHVHSKSTYTGVPPSTDNHTATASDEAAQPRALDPQILESRLREAAGDKIQPHGAIVVGAIMQLITAGADLELDVLPAIRAAAQRLSRPARSWTYFVPIIQDAMDRRRAAGSWERAQPPPDTAPRLTAHQQRQKQAMDAFEKFRGGQPNDEFAGNTIDLEERDFSAH